MRSFSVARQDMVVIHELAMNGMRGLVRHHAHIVVRAGKACAVKDAVRANETLRESSAPSMLTGHDIHPTIRRVKQGCQFPPVLGTKWRQRIANDLARLINGVARGLHSRRTD